MPLVVIRHGIPESVEEHGLAGLGCGIEQVWQKLQRDLACLVPGWHLLVARRSHHQIAQEQPARAAARGRHAAKGFGEAR